MKSKKSKPQLKSQKSSLLSFYLWFYLFTFTFCLMWVSGVRAADEDPMTDDRVVIKTEGSHQLLLPNDWPVHQDKEGRPAAASIEEYISMKFGQVRARFGQMDARIEGLERQLAQLEKGQRDLLKGIKLLEERTQQQEASDGGQEKTGSEAQGSGAPSQ